LSEIRCGRAEREVEKRRRIGEAVCWSGSSRSLGKGKRQYIAKNGSIGNDHSLAMPRFSSVFRLSAAVL